MFSIETKTKTNNRLKIIELRTIDIICLGFLSQSNWTKGKIFHAHSPIRLNWFWNQYKQILKTAADYKNSTSKSYFSFIYIFIYMIIAYRINLSLNGLCQSRQSVGTSRFLSCNWNSECILIILYTVHWLPGNVFCQFIKPIASLGLQCTTLNLPEIEIWMFKVIWESNWRSQFFQTVRSLE